MFTWFLMRAEAEDIHCMLSLSMRQTPPYFMANVDTWGNRRETDRSIKKNIGGKVKK